MAHPDLDQLVDFCLGFAQSQLKKNGSFFPFAATVLEGGRIAPLAVHSGDDKPSADALIKELAEIIVGVTSRGEADAVAICYDGRVSIAGGGGRKKDSITVVLEHRNGESIAIYLPYSKKLFGYKYDPIIATANDRRFFG